MTETITKFRKEYKTIEAVQLTIDSFAEVYKFIGEQVPFENCSVGGVDKDHTFKLRRPWGAARVSLGDYIVKDPKGGFYCCTQRVFESTTEKMEEPCENQD